MSDLVFKLVLDAEVNDYISNVDRSGTTTKAVFDAIKKEADKLRQASEEAAKQIGEIIPKGTKELADALTTSLTKATGMIENAGDEAFKTAKNFTDLGIKSGRALDQLKQDLVQSKQKLQELSNADANPKSIAAARAAVDQLEKEVEQADSAFTKFERAVLQANKEVKNTQSTAIQAQKGIDGLKSSYTTLVSAMAAIGVGVGINELIKTADTYTNLSARIKIAVGDTGNFEQAMAGVHQTAVLTNSNLDSTAALFTQITYVGKELGLVQSDVLGLTKTITQAVQTGGGSAQATDAAITQLIQSLNSGRLAGEEFNSVSEQAPVITRALAKELGVTTAELRKMAENGDLTSKVVIRSLQNQSKVIDEEYKKLPLTVEKALQRIQTQWQITIGEINNSTGTTESIANGLLIIADNLDIVRKFIDDVGIGFNNLTGELSKGIDASTIESFKSAISSAYDAVKQLASTLLELGSDVIDTVGSALTTIASTFSSFTGDVSSASNQVSILERSFQGISIILGFISDGLYGIKIVLELLTGSFFGLAAGAYKALEAITWGDVSKQFANNADVMLAKAKEYFSEADKDAIEFQSQGKKRADEAIQTEEQKQQAIRDESKLTLNQLLSDQKEESKGKQVSESEKLEAVQKYAEAAIKANGGIIDGTMQADLMTKGYIVTLDAAGKVAVQAWDASGKAAKEAAEASKISAEKAKQADDEYTAFLKTSAIQKIQLQKQIEDAKRSGDLNALKSAQDSLTAIDIKEKELASARKQRALEAQQDASGFGKAIENAAKQGALALGVDLDAALNKVSRGFKEKLDQVNDLAAGIDRLGATGDQAASIIYDAWSKWLETAKSQAEIDAAKAKLLEFEKQGVFSTKQVEMGMLAIKQVTEKLPNDLDEVGKAFDRLGIKTKEQLKLAAQSAIADFNTIKASGKATSDGLKQAYERVMQAAAASGDQAVIANAKAQGASVGLQAQIDETGKSSVQSTQEIVDSLYKVGETARGSAADGFRELGRVAREEAKSTADEWIDAMAKIDAERKAKDASNNKGLSELQGGIDQMAQDYYDRLVAAGMDQSRARDLADKARYSLAVETTTSLKGGTTQNMNTTKQEMEKTLAYWENRKLSKSGSGSISAIDTSASISAPNIQAPIIEPTKTPIVETSPAKNVSIQLSYAGYSAELSGTQDQVDAAEELFRQLEEAKKRS
ncbi:MAG: tape measure protein [Acinetobacter venetianus]|uniref:tape measure protein n=1 Tax=Acinetobacter venetianus TaxID=52133 RepID=UPI003C7692E7